MSFLSFTKLHSCDLRPHLHTTHAPLPRQVLTFIDLAGHERYLKTTVFGLTGHMPDFAMLMIGANQGVVGMTKGAPGTDIYV